MIVIVSAFGSISMNFLIEFKNLLVERFPDTVDGRVGAHFFVYSFLGIGSALRILFIDVLQVENIP